MKIIAIEGLDKAGKAIQSRLLVGRLLQDGFLAKRSEHHRYDTPTGELIMKWLKKEWDVDQETIELIMTADKQAQQKWYQELEDAGLDFLILDRYMLSQYVYATANKIDPQWTVSLQSYLRRPDMDIVVDIPAEESMKRKGKHNNGQNDRYESDLEMLAQVRDNYIIANEKHSAPLKYIVSGMGSIEDIHEDIYSIVYDNLIAK